MKRKYDTDFKRNTVQKVFDGQSVASVSRELGVGESLIHTAVGNERLYKTATGNKAVLS